MDRTDFLSQAWKMLARALADLGVGADLDLRPATLSKRVKRRCMAELGRLSVLVRRLIFLMALSIEPDPSGSREGRNYFSSDTAAPGPRKRSLRLIPAPAAAFPEALRIVSGPPLPGYVSAAPVLDRWHMLLDAFQQRERRAKCLAGVFRRWQARGEARPRALPMAHTHRFSPELGLIAAALPMLLNRALARWPDTG